MVRPFSAGRRGRVELPSICNAAAMRLMRWNFADMLDRAIAPMPVFMILVAGGLTKIGYFNCGMACTTGLCALLIRADLLTRRRNQAAI
jgi:hypothetical protein